jgi:putative transcriptional regulator
LDGRGIKTVTKRYKSEALRAAHKTATGLHRLGLIDTKTMRELDVSCLTNVEKLSAQEIAAVSQNLLPQ